jgi:cyclin E
LCLIRFRGNENNNDEDLETKAKRPKLKPEDLWYPFKVQERKNYQRVNSNNLLSQHQGLSPRMRTILLDWLIEVCEVYRLHRETFYLAADFFDRYMSNTAQIPKTKLQLIGTYFSMIIISKNENFHRIFIL